MATKRKKAQKAKDFVKPKLKVGKTAAKPDNHTDTSFTAKTISLPNQSIAKKLKSGVSEEQKQEIDLSHHLSLTKHHASATRKEVLIYIDQHLPSNPSLYKQIFTLIIPLILDQSASVRTTLVALFNKCANMQPGILELHIRSIALFIHSAMTHLHPEIRNSSTKFLNVLVEHAPQSLSKSFFVKTMRSYFTLMSWTLTDDKKSVSLAITTSAAIGGSVKKARIGHLAVLKAFLQASLFPQLSDSAESEINPAIVVSVHPQSYKYLIPAATSQAFAPLKLFANELPKSKINGFNTILGQHNSSSNSKDIDDGKFHISDLDTITAEDLDTRRKVFVDVFQKPVVKNLNSLVKEGGEVGREANSCMTIIDNLEQELKKVAEDE